MLRTVSIKNFAIIDDLHVEFADGLTILSGETGAGKSIIVNAVNLLLGSRATSRLIRSGKRTAELAACFSLEPHGRLAAMIKDLGFEDTEKLHIQRWISTKERHRIAINGRSSTLQQLKRLTRNIASISGQHAHQGLLEADQQLLILDQYGGLMPLRKTVAQQYRSLLPLIKERDALVAMNRRQNDHMDLLHFQQAEIRKADLAAGEDTALEKEILRLKNVEALQKTVHAGIQTLYSAQGAVIEQLIETRKQLESVAQLDPALEAAIAPLNDATYQVEDAVEMLRSYLGNLELDDQRLAAAEERLDLLNRLKRKYGGSLQAVFEHQRSIADKLNQVAHLDDSIRAVEERLARKHLELSQACRSLSQKRRQCADRLSRRVVKELESLHMPKTAFEIHLQPIGPAGEVSRYLMNEDVLLTESGSDQVSFRISPNVGESLKPLSEIASGGELSRMILALKALLASTDAVETVVFDEVDAGIGGGVAEVVGKKLADLSGRHQVICITHLPQIAKFGKHHYHISKAVVAGRTKTRIRRLSPAERIEEIARMLAGEKITAKTLAHAKEMLADFD